MRVLWRTILVATLGLALLAGCKEAGSSVQGPYDPYTDHGGGGGGGGNGGGGGM